MSDTNRYAVMDECFEDFQHFLSERKERCRRAEDFKRYERNVRLRWTSKLTKGPQPPPTFRVL
jgi:hypothetical protein